MSTRPAPRPVLRSSAGRLNETTLMRAGFLSDEEREALEGAIAGVRTVSPGAELLREGEPTDSLFILTHGWACRFKTTRDGARQMPALLVPGDIANLDNLLFRAADYGVRALSSATLLVLPRDRALALSDHYPGIARTLTWAALVENAILSQWALCLGRLSARQRLAHLMCELSVRLALPGEQATTRYDLPLTQEQLADVLGLTSVHVNRTLQQLRAEKLIEARGRSVAIADMDELRRVGDFDPAYLHIAREPIGPGRADGDLSQSAMPVRLHVD